MAISPLTDSTEENIMSIRTAETDTDSRTTAASGGSGSARSTLWLLLAISATCNVVTSVAHMLVISIGFGLVTLSLGIALMMQHYRGRRR